MVVTQKAKNNNATTILCPSDNIVGMNQGPQQEPMSPSSSSHLTPDKLSSSDQSTFLRQHEKSASGNSEGLTQISSQQILAVSKDDEEEKEEGQLTESKEQIEKKEVKKTALQIKVSECLEKFYELMNDHASTLGMKRSNFAVAHGMHHDNNYSTAAAIGRLCCVTMKNDMFRQVVQESIHKYKSTVHKEHIYEWENTNLLLK